MLQLLFQQTLTLFALVDPIVLIPIFMALISEIPEAQHLRFVRSLSILVFLILFTTALAGPFLFSLLGLSMTSLQIAGNIVLFSMGIAMLMGQQVHINAKGSRDEMADYSLIPLATPLLAGPASISYVMTSHSTNPSFWITPLTCLFASLFVFITFFLARRLRSIRLSYLAIIERLAGLLVMVMAIDGLSRALKTTFPILAG